MKSAKIFYIPMLFASLVFFDTKKCAAAERQHDRKERCTSATSNGVIMVGGICTALSLWALLEEPNPKAVINLCTGLMMIGAGFSSKKSPYRPETLILD